VLTNILAVEVRLNCVCYCYYGCYYARKATHTQSAWRLCGTCRIVLMVIIMKCYVILINVHVQSDRLPCVSAAHVNCRRFGRNCWFGCLFVCAIITLEYNNKLAQIIRFS